jgi:bacillopeptidase F (M6 metalloprotease family)
MEENVTKVRALVRYDRHLTVTMIGSELNLNHQTIHNILTEELGNAHTWMLHHDYAQSHCHLREQCFDQNGYSSGSKIPILA